MPPILPEDDLQQQLQASPGLGKPDKKRYLRVAE
jgi:hypothetical protein